MASVSVLRGSYNSLYWVKYSAPAVAINAIWYQQIYIFLFPQKPYNTTQGYFFNKPSCLSSARRRGNLV